MRVDLALKRLLLVRSRAEGKEACDVGAVRINGVRVKASAAMHVGDRVEIDYAHRTLEIELVHEIGPNVSRAQAKTMYRVVRDEPVA
ncbi:MAG TPA: S4 domain-containing protein [Gemmatimonadaceae bacterium]|nr:S4 domain-containing protein [Gemmatimonadaceae bacterium]